jgi:hypothetical protein
MENNSRGKKIFSRTSTKNVGIKKKFYTFAPLFFDLKPQHKEKYA